MAKVDKLAAYFEPERLMEEALKAAPGDMVVVGLILDTKQETLKAIQNCADSPADLAAMLRDLADKVESQQPINNTQIN